MSSTRTSDIEYRLVACAHCGLAIPGEVSDLYITAANLVAVLLGEAYSETSVRDLKKAVEAAKPLFEVVR